MRSTIGQSFRLEAPRDDIFPEGTGLSERVSDFVGRTEVRFRNLVSFTHRFRLDKDNFAIRRNEIDATVGSRRTYLEVGYLRLNRDIATVEDLRDREELRAAARIAIGRKWSVFGSGVFNLTDADEDPVFQPDGFEPIRTRLGVAYSDDCIEFGATGGAISSTQAMRGAAMRSSCSLRSAIWASADRRELAGLANGVKEAAESKPTTLWGIGRGSASIKPVENIGGTLREGSRELIGHTSG